VFDTGKDKVALSLSLVALLTLAACGGGSTLVAADTITDFADAVMLPPSVQFVYGNLGI